jgi:cyclopropane fatty-acyl-phospholipid synthase-like methyltransferase
MNSLDLVRKYRTGSSIIEEDVLEVSRQLNSLKTPKYFLDFGCHFGHLAIYLALNHDITIFAVDNFRS